MNKLIHIGIYGLGNVGQHLLERLLELNQFKLTVCTRTYKNITVKANVELTTEIANLQGCDLIICAVTDQWMLPKIEELATIAPTVSTSGTVNLSSLNTPFQVGTFYPLQSFVASQPVNWKGLPILVHAANKKLENTLLELGNLLSEFCFVLNPEERKKLHLAAVFANNFTTHLFDIAAHYCTENNLQFDWLKPLIFQSISKLKDVEPHAIQTGPAKRNDQTTIQEHLAMLEGTNKELYKLLTQSIQNHFNHDKL